ncbi:MAG TPA: YibE/F family protein, partial [Ruminococcaceae bacterium]|nr:YibE/F family protein [Oscillospiraceae bacterium]
GKDIMGTMANTLILAYIGSSLVMVLIYGASRYPLFQLLNKEEIIIELLQSLVGIMGMLFTIPFTTAASSLLLGRAEAAKRRPISDRRYGESTRGQKK